MPQLLRTKRYYNLNREVATATDMLSLSSSEYTRIKRSLGVLKNNGFPITLKLVKSQLDGDRGIIAKKGALSLKLAGVAPGDDITEAKIDIGWEAAEVQLQNNINYIAYIILYWFKLENAIFDKILTVHPQVKRKKARGIAKMIALSSAKTLQNSITHVAIGDTFPLKNTEEINAEVEATLLTMENDIQSVNELTLKYI